MLLAFGRMLLSLAVVLGLLWMVARVGRSRQTGRRGRNVAGPANDGRVDLLGRRSIGRNSSIAVVRVDGRTMVVGQTPQQITLLAESSEAGAAGRPLDVDRLSAEPRALRAGASVDHLEPWPAPGSGADAPNAWDALLERLREMTVRH